jgi:hypothetical protein
LNYTLASWALENNDKDSSNLATALSCPGVIANWPVVDWCRSYVFMVFTKPGKEEQKPEMFQQMKAAIDETRPMKCSTQ